MGCRSRQPRSWRFTQAAHEPWKWTLEPSPLLSCLRIGGNLSLIQHIWKDMVLASWGLGLQTKHESLQGSLTHRSTHYLLCPKFSQSSSLQLPAPLVKSSGVYPRWLGTIDLHSSIRLAITRDALLLHPIKASCTSRGTARGLQVF